MQSTLRLRTAALVALSVFPLAGFAANGGTFMNGQSIYGQPAAQGAPVRVVDLASTDRLNVAYGESVTFRSGTKQFSWTFDGLDRRSVDVNQIAPAGFAGKPVVVYVGRNPSNRRRGCGGRFGELVTALGRRTACANTLRPVIGAVTFRPDG